MYSIWRSSFCCFLFEYWVSREGACDSSGLAVSSISLVGIEDYCTEASTEFSFDLKALVCTSPLLVKY